MPNSDQSKRAKRPIYTLTWLRLFCKYIVHACAEFKAFKKVSIEGDQQEPLWYSNGEPRWKLTLEINGKLRELEADICQARVSNGFFDAAHIIDKDLK